MRPPRLMPGVRRPAINMITSTAGERRSLAGQLLSGLLPINAEVERDSVSAFAQSRPRSRHQPSDQP